MASSENSNSGIKAMTGLLAILATVGGMAAIVRPMSQSIDDLRNEHIRLAEALNVHLELPGHRGSIERLNAFELQLASLLSDLSAHKNTIGHPGVLADLARIEVKFAEVETQFKAMKELFQVELVAHTNSLTSFEDYKFSHEKDSVFQNTTHTERIKFLEKQLDELKAQLGKIAK